LNMAKAWGLPVLWVCENNCYGMGTSPDRASAVSDIIQKACGYGMPAFDVDGMDVLAMKQMITERLKDVREGKGPQFVEAITYRFRGHSMGDPERYRTKEEVQKYEEIGPIHRFKKLILDEGAVTQKDLDEIDQEVEKEVEESVEFAHESPEPADDSLFDNVYAEEYGG
jgi:pyruvate dehydrogenase E1 component alpha subunit